MNFFDISEAIISGIVSIPVDVYYGARRTAEDVGFFGNDVRLENAAERERLISLIGRVFNGDHRMLINMIEIILNQFFDKVPDSVLQRMASAAGMRALEFGVRSATKTFLINLISSRIINRAVSRAAIQRVTKIAVGMILTAAIWQGLLERASNASQRLRISNSGIYQTFRNQNLDMIYFLIEDHVQPYLEAVKIADTNSAEFQRLLREIERRFP